MRAVLARLSALFTPGNIDLDIQGSEFSVRSYADIDAVVFEVVSPGGDPQCPLVLHADLIAGERVVLRGLDEPVDGDV